MIGIKHISIEHVPCLVVEDVKYADQALPLFVYFHGITSAKEHNLPIAYLLAEAGYRIVLPDSHLHGERENGATSTEKQLAFWNIVFKNTEELEKIRAYYQDRSLILNGRIDIAGTSMGGITTAACLNKYDWIHAGALMMGTAKLSTYARLLVDNLKKQGNLPIDDEEIRAIYDNIAQYDLSETIEKLNGRPLFIWHGESDPVIPYKLAKDFYEEVKPHYQDDGKLKMISEPKRGHKVSRQAILEAVEWFTSQL